MDQMSVQGRQDGAINGYSLLPFKRFFCLTSGFFFFVSNPSFSPIIKYCLVYASEMQLNKTPKHTSSHPPDTNTLIHNQKIINTKRVQIFGKTHTKWSLMMRWEDLGSYTSFGVEPQNICLTFQETFFLSVGSWLLQVGQMNGPQTREL